MSTTTTAAAVTIIGDQMFLYSCRMLKGIIELTGRYIADNGDNSENYLRIMHVCQQSYDMCLFLLQNITFITRDENNVDTVRSVYNMDWKDVQYIASRFEQYMYWLMSTFEHYRSLYVMNTVKVSVQSLSGMDMDQTAKAIRTVTIALSESKAGGDVLLVNNKEGLPSGVSYFEFKFNDSDLFERFEKQSNESREFAENIPQLGEMLKSAILLRAGAGGQSSRGAALNARIGTNGRKYVALIYFPNEPELAFLLAHTYAAYLNRLFDSMETSADYNGGASSGRPIRVVVNAYTVDYSKLLSKYTGESELNFERLMNWFADLIKYNNSNSDANGRITFNVLIFKDIDVLMGPRVTTDPEHISTIKNSMLQFMDEFNKNTDLQYFSMLFTTGKPPIETGLDEAFRRRVEINVLFSDRAINYIRMPILAYLFNAHALNSTEQIFLEILTKRTNYIGLLKFVAEQDIKVTSSIKNGFYMHDINQRRLYGHDDEYDELVDLSMDKTIRFNLDRKPIYTSEIIYVCTPSPISQNSSRLYHRDPERKIDSNYLSDEIAAKSIFMWAQ